MKAITEATLMPISLVLVLIGGVSWLSTLHAKTESVGFKVEKVEVMQDEYNRNLKEILVKLSRIEGRLEADGHKR